MLTRTSVPLLLAVRSRSVLAAASVLWTGAALLTAAPGADDWPQFLGPQRNGVSDGPGLAKAWPKEGPPVIWQRDVGEGFSGPAVSDERLILFHRLSDQAVVECLEARSGKVVWKAGHSTDYRDDFGFDPGPRATPTIADGRVFTFGAEGRLSCWRFETGESLWTVDTAKELGAGKGWFGRACSPLVVRNLVVLILGGREGAGVVAFDVANGSVRWKATEDEASYASPITIDIQGRRTVLALTREALVGLLPADGSVLFRYPWRPAMRASVSAATPVVIGNRVFLSASYGAGAVLLRLESGGPKLIWSAEDALSNHYATSVHHRSFLYGWHGRQEQGCDIRCVELETGKVKWSESGLKAGTVTLVGDELLVLTEQGELIRCPASPEGFQPTARVQGFPAGVRAYPALSKGLLFARSKSHLMALDLSKEP